MDNCTLLSEVKVTKISQENNLIKRLRSLITFQLLFFHFLTAVVWSSFVGLKVVKQGHL